MAYSKHNVGLWGVSFGKGATLGLLFMLVLCTFAVPVYAGIPTSENEIPLVPGSKPDPQEQALWEEYSEFGDMALFVGGYQLPLLWDYHAFYTTNAPVEEVARYYAMKFDAVELDTDPDLESLANGETTPVGVDYGTYEWQFTDEYDHGGRIIRSGAKVREALSKNRRQHSPGEWLYNASFSWVHRDLEGNLVLFVVDCEDRSFNEDYSEFQGVKTLIAIHSYTYMSEEDTWEMEDEAMDEYLMDIARKMALLPPTSESLGIPIYPSAEFQPELSAGMSLSGMPMHVYFSTDTPFEVITWYEQETGMTSESWEADSYSLALIGQMPFPEKGLTVQPNILFDGPWKTMITLVIGGGASDDWSDY